MAEPIHLHGLTLEREGLDGVLTVLRDLDLSLESGQRLALIGGNGSGKSSLLRHLATPGVLPDHRVGLVFQDPDEQLIAGTVAEELTLGRPQLDAEPILQRFGLAGRGGEDPRLLSAGQKQRLQLAVVLADDPDLLLLDEPTSLQDADQAAWLRRHLAAWEGTMIWATQQPDEVALCHEALVLDVERRLEAGPVATVLARPSVHQLLTPDYPPTEIQTVPMTRTVVQLTDVVCRFNAGGALRAPDLEIHAGDRLGITGLNGCGKSTLLAVMAGLRRPDEGTVQLAGSPLYERGSVHLDHGQAALAPQFPEYLFTRGQVGDEIGLDPLLAGTDTGAFLERLGLAASLAQRHPQDLSGGQKRRLALALALFSRRSLILLDEPTAALDAAGRVRVARLVAAADPAGALVVASHDTAFLAACGCRTVALAPAG